MLFAPRNKWPLAIAAIVLAALLVDIALVQPALLVDAFNPVSLNIAGGSLSFGAIGGTVGSGIAGIICVGLSIPTGGGAALACAVIGGAAGGMAGGALGTKGGEMMGDYLYRQTTP
ncbi:DoxX-like family protein [Pseudomonas sp. W2-17]